MVCLLLLPLLLLSLLLLLILILLCEFVDGFLGWCACGERETEGEEREREREKERVCVCVLVCVHAYNSVHTYRYVQRTHKIMGAWCFLPPLSFPFYMENRRMSLYSIFFSSSFLAFVPGKIGVCRRSRRGCAEGHTNLAPIAQDPVCVCVCVCVCV